MGTWLTKQNADVHYTRFYQSSALPDIEALDLIIAMGGPMSVNDEAEYPWLKMEKRFIREAIGRGVAIVGVCLGAQLIASALGARVYANREKEIGWFPIEAVKTDAPVFQFPPKATVFHWHGETFDLPSGATLLAKSAVCENQAFQVGKNVIGLQFHLETTPETANLIIHHCREELVDGAHIQPEMAMRAVPAAAYTTINALAGDVLSYVTRRRDDL
jgi:GMP synthase-like glutamine amidotransferase